MLLLAVWRNHRGSFAPVSSDAERQVGTMCPGPRDGPGRQGRDSPQDVIIAPGILMRLVPGSPAASYLGSRKAALKLIRGLLEHFSETLERGGEIGFGGQGGRRGSGARGKQVTLQCQGVDLRL